MRQGGDSLIKTSVAPVYGASPIIDPLAEGGGVSGFELKKTNELDEENEKKLMNLMKKMKRHESRLKNKLSETTSVSSSSNSTLKRTSTRKDVPCEVSKLP